MNDIRFANIDSISDEYLYNHMVHWVKVFRAVTGTGLKEAKDIFDVLYGSGYDMNTVLNLVKAAALYHTWLAEAGSKERLQDVLRVAIDINRLAEAGLSNILADVKFSTLPLDMCIPEDR